MNHKMIVLAMVAAGLPTMTEAHTAYGITDNSATSLLADSSKVFDIDEVVVVSQPKETYRLRQQSLSSTSLGSFQIQKLGVHDLRELSSYIPNFTMPNYGSRLSSAMYVRGIGSRVNSPAVGIYQDGIPLMSKAAFNLHNYQTSRVDVLRGPQGTLYGQNSEGGLVRIFSRNPFEYEGTDIKLSYGSRYYRNIEAAHYQKLGTHVALSAAGFYEGQKGFFRNTHTGERADKYDEAGGKLQLKTKWNKGWSIDWLANYQYVDQNGFPYGKLNLETGKTELPASTFAGNYRRNTLITGLDIQHLGRDFSFSSTTSYQYLKDRMLMDQDYLPTDYMSILQEQLQNAITQELTIKSRKPVGDIWNWTVGAFFSYNWLKTNGPVYFNEGMTRPIGNAIQSQMYTSMVTSMTKQLIAQGKSEAQAQAAAAAAIERAGGVKMDVAMGAPGLFHTPQWNLGIFHESNLELTDRLTATIGLRYDFMHTAIHYASSAYMAMTANVMGRVATNTLRSVLDHKTSDNYHQLLPKIGINWKIDAQGSNVYAIVSKGYRAGGYNIQMFSDILQTELNANRQQAMRGDYDVPHSEEDYDKVNKTIAFKPETSWNYELGAHLNLFDHMMHLDLSTYYMQVRNQQLSVMAGNYGFGRMMVNAGKSHSCGVEAALKGQAVNGKLDWAVSYGLTRAQFDEYEDGNGDGSDNGNGQANGKAVSYKGKTVPYVPQNTLAAMVDYRLDLQSASPSHAWLSMKSLTIGANVHAQGKTYWDNANSYAQKMYAVLGAHLDLDLGGMLISLWGRNLTDTHYNTFAVDNAATGKKEYFAQRGNPFQMGVDIKWHF